MAASLLIQFSSTNLSGYPFIVMFTLTNLFLSGILMINSVAILNEERFLARIGWGKDSINQPSSSSSSNSYQNYGGNYDSGNVSVKHQLITLISATRTLMRIPLVLINIVVILFLIVLG